MKEIYLRIGKSDRDYYATFEPALPIRDEGKVVGLGSIVTGSIHGFKQRLDVALASSVRPVELLTCIDNSISNEEIALFNSL